MDAVVIALAEGLGLQTVIGWIGPVYVGLTGILPALLAVFFHTDKSSEYNKVAVGEERPPEIKYDFIVVGAGTAGSIVASRLSKHFTVLLLERGGEPNPLTKVPGLQGAMVGRAENDYRYLTVPQNSSCLSYNNRQCLWHSGIGLGGSSNVNVMIYIRGHPSDYDNWAKFAKDERWKYKNVLPYFLRTECYCGDCEKSSGVRPSINPKYHSSEGELPNRPLPVTPMVSEFLEACEWAGIPKGDYNAPFNKPIADVISYTQRNGRRVTSYDALVKNIRHSRPSLRVMKFSRVTKVLFDVGKNQAIGVEYERFGKTYVAKAAKEVILSAGTIATPKILLLSGVGPENDLEELEIPVRANLPVGRNLQVHVGAYIGPFTVNAPVSIVAERDITRDAALNFIQNGTGPLSVQGVKAMAIWTSSRALKEGEEEWPDVVTYMNSNAPSRNSGAALAATNNNRAEFLNEFLNPVGGRDGFNLLTTYSRPKSRGIVKLRSANYTDEPLIDPRCYEDPAQEDIRVTVESMQKGLYIVENAPSFRRLGATLSTTPFPTCKHLVFRSEHYWECLARQNTIVTHHFCGTATMGHPSSKDAVVDSELKVIGLNNLRVIDASVMPYVTSANTMAPTMMIAERAVDFILECWKKDIVPGVVFH